MSVKKCSKCNVVFECTNEQTGCWCENVHLNLETLKKLKEQYVNCLCSSCLKEYSKEQEKL